MRSGSNSPEEYKNIEGSGHDALMEASKVCHCKGKDEILISPKTRRIDEESKEIKRKKRRAEVELENEKLKEIIWFLRGSEIKNLEERCLEGEKRVEALESKLRMHYNYAKVNECYIHSLQTEILNLNSHHLEEHNTPRDNVSHTQHNSSFNIMPHQTHINKYATLYEKMYSKLVGIEEITDFGEGREYKNHGKRSFMEFSDVLGDGIIEFNNLREDNLDSNRDSPKKKAKLE